MSDLSKVLYDNAMALIYTERRLHRDVDWAWRVLARGQTVKAGLGNWLNRPFANTPLEALGKFKENYRLMQAAAMLKEAAAEVRKG